MAAERKRYAVLMPSVWQHGSVGKIDREKRSENRSRRCWMLKMQRSSNDIKISLLQHSQAKVSLYGAYLSIYLNILSRSKHFTNILLFDLLCGEGLYEGDSKGSPLVAL